MSTPRVSRREFAAALAAGAPLLAPPPAPADEDKPPADPLGTATDGLTAVVLARHGKHLTEAQRKRVKAGIRANLATAERLRKRKLANGDEPDFIFSADTP